MGLSRRQKTLLLYVSLALYGIVVGLLIRDRYISFTRDDYQVPVIHHTKPTPKEKKTVIPKTEEIPSTKLLEVPFLVQAPLGVWDELHEETCEEASLMMVQYFRTQKSFGSSDSSDEEIKELVAWQTRNGYAVDVTVEQLSLIAKGYYQLASGRIINNPTVNQIKAEIAAGRPVIVPAAGQVLPNPYFTPPGPKYHMIVIRGYDDDGFITNDPGTRRGENFHYTYDSLMTAMHNWNRADILSGPKAVLVFD